MVPVRISNKQAQSDPDSEDMSFTQVFSPGMGTQ